MTDRFDDDNGYAGTRDDKSFWTDDESDDTQRRDFEREFWKQVDAEHTAEMNPDGVPDYDWPED